MNFFDSKWDSTSFHVPEPEGKDEKYECTSFYFLSSLSTQFPKLGRGLWQWQFI